MKFSLQQKQKLIQKLALTPQMKQALHLLQLPVMELKTLIAQELTENPLLSTEEEMMTEGDDDSQANADTQEDEKSQDMEFDALDENVDEYLSAHEQHSTAAKEQKKYDFITNIISRPPTLQEHLLKQLGMLLIASEERLIGEFMIGNIDERGYLAISLEEICQTLNVGLELVKKVLRIIQQFDPAGVGARDLRECLLIQLKRHRVEEDSLAVKIVEGDLDNLAKHRFEVITKKYRVSLDEIKGAIQRIGALDPRPGAKYETEPVTYATPDVYMVQTKEGLQVSLNNEELPELRVNKAYLKLMKSKKTGEDVKEYLKERLNSAQWIIKAIGQRQQTLTKIANYVAITQQEALEKGLAYLKPLTIRDIARGIEMHESTVSRAITNKYVQAPIGLVSFKDLLSRKVETVDADGSASSDEVRAEILEIINKEDPVKPISDSKLASYLTIKGYNVARRTVAKYREELNIAPSHLRKRKHLMS